VEAAALERSPAPGGGWTYRYTLTPDQAFHLAGTTTYTWLVEARNPAISYWKSSAAGRFTTASQPPTPTATATPTATQTPVAGFAVTGTVCEFPPPGCSGVLRGATVTLEPLGWMTTTSLDQGRFAFAGIPNGRYTLTISPSCTPFGCYDPTPVTVAGVDVEVLIQPRPLATPTHTPTATFTATPTETLTATPTATPPSLPDPVVVATIFNGFNGPAAVAVNPTTNRVYVTNYSSSTISVIQD
jgi:hypothetical protein